MSQPQHMQELYMDDGTTADEVLDFVVQRTMNPAIFRDGEVVVFNYHNQSLDTAALAEWASEADPGVYMVAYQVSPVWAFMVQTLPLWISDGDYLAYRQDDAEYVDYANWTRVLESDFDGFADPARVDGLIADVEWAAEEVRDDVRL